ncbi:DUF4199 domain-containing protein [Pontibacter locisalis]|uniref:DUF4199 domain-containing protein n=1 Tax=Pontibacter locisalis TaxID=1719035 RepID=A0ABW5IG11_9BACT
MERVGIKYGVLTAAGLIGYFVIMMLLGLTDVIELRFLNGVIMAIGVTLAIRAYKISVNGQIAYLQGFGVGTITAVVATTLFAALMVLYIKIAGEGLVSTLSTQRYLGERVMSTPGVVVFIVLMLEGVISGVMISFIAMQWFKRDEHKVPNSP